MTTARLSVRVLHKAEDGPTAWRPFAAGDTLREVFAFDVTASLDLLAAAPETAFAVCNSYPGELHCSPEYVDAVAAYRAGGNRSLSVGDVVIVGETAYACEPAGWRLLSADDLTAPAETCTRHGSTACPDPYCVRERGGSVLGAELADAERWAD